MDADGFFYFTARLKRMIKSSGFNVYPAQVEGVLCEHPGGRAGVRRWRARRGAGPAREGVRRRRGSRARAELAAELIDFAVPG